MPTVDYSYYSGEYGGTLSESDFVKSEKRAEVYLKNITHGKLTAENAGEYENVKDCICEMADAVFSYSEKTEKEKKSETTDGYSVSYVTERKDGVDSVSAMRVKLYQIAKFWLMDTGLLSLKIPCCQIRT